MVTDTLDRRRLAYAASEPEAALTPLAVEEVCEAHFDYVFRCLRGLGVREDLVDDALQDVFEVVQRKLASFDGKARLRTWLYAIVLRVARRYRERAAKEARRFVAAEPESGVRAEAHLERNEQLAAAKRALAALDGAKREVFVLAMVEQMSAPEIAAVLGVPVNTVYSRLRAARAAFRDQIAHMKKPNVPGEDESGPRQQRGVTPRRKP